MKNTKEYLTLEEIINFIKQNYIKNIWNNGLKQLEEKFKYYYDTPITSIELKLINEQYEKLLAIRLYYHVWGSHYRIRKFYIADINNQVTIINDGMNDNEFYLLKNIFDFTNLYNYLIDNNLSEYTNFNIKCAPFDRSVSLQIRSDKILIGYNNKYSHEYSMKFGNMQINEIKDNNCEKEINEEILNFATNTNFLKNIKIPFNELPIYIQENYESIMEDENKRNGGFQRCIKKLNPFKKNNK